MCDPVTAMVVGGTAVSAFGELKKGSAESKARKANAAQMEKAKFAVDQKAAVDVDAVTRDYRLATGRNQNAIGKSGVDASAFFDILADDAAQANLEVQKIYYSAESEKQNLSFSAASERTAAKNAKTASYINAASTVLMGGAKAYSSMSTPSSSASSPGLSFNEPYQIK